MVNTKVLRIKSAKSYPKNRFQTDGTQECQKCFIHALNLQRLESRQQNLPQKGCNCLERSNVCTLRCSNLELMVSQKDALPISPTCPLFVFSRNCLKQMARSLLTPLQIFILFYMVACILFSMAAPITTYFKDFDWLLKIFSQKEDG